MVAHWNGAPWQQFDLWKETSSTQAEKLDEYLPAAPYAGNGPANPQLLACMSDIPNPISSTIPSLVEGVGTRARCSGTFCAGASIPTELR
jgi:hypothetical protein